jgi:hypothetical protein
MAAIVGIRIDHHESGVERLLEYVQQKPADAGSVPSLVI